MNTALVIVNDDRLPELTRVKAELVGFMMPYSKLVNGCRYTLSALKVDVRVISTGVIWYGVWATRCTPVTQQARDLLKAHGPRRRQ